MKKRIDENYKWRFPTIVDKHPELIEYLKTNPPYEEALYLRKILLKKMDWHKTARMNSAGKPERPQIDLFNLPRNFHLKLVQRHHP